jgi:hypothetical protein
LYSKKNVEKFKVFIGFQNLVCTNLCVSTDGYADELRVSHIGDLQKESTGVISGLQYQYPFTGYE